MCQHDQTVLLVAGPVRAPHCRVGAERQGAGQRDDVLGHTHAQAGVLQVVGAAHSDAVLGTGQEYRAEGAVAGQQRTQ